MISIIGVVGNVLVLVDTAYFWKNYPSGHSLIVNLTLTGKTDDSKLREREKIHVHKLMLVTCTVQVLHLVMI